MEQVVSKSMVEGAVRPPCSKSYAQRTLAAALLANGTSYVGNLEMCDDTLATIKVIQDLGAEVKHVGERRYSVKGGFAPKTDLINVAESGLSARLFTPIAALWDKEMTVNGRGTMLHRPMNMILRPLKDLGVEVKSDGFLPVRVKGPIKGGETKVEGYVSSQFVTGLLMALPKAQSHTTLYVENPASIPYLAMTIDVASRFGIKIEHSGFSKFHIPSGQEYTPVDCEIDGDWSGAAFMLVAGAIAGRVTVRNMNSLSLQADKVIVDILSHVGAEVTVSGNDVTVSRRELKAFQFNAHDCPDLFPILAVLAANCEGTTVIKGASRLLHKECNRAKAIMSEYTKLGIDVMIDDHDTMTVNGGPITGGRINSCADHRIAMAAAIAGLVSSSPVTIEGSEAVSKSYPYFWDDLAILMKK